MAYSQEWNEIPGTRNEARKCEKENYTKECRIYSNGQSKEARSEKRQWVGIYNQISVSPAEAWGMEWYGEVG